jgi:hypothetical protein
MTVGTEIDTLTLKGARVGLPSGTPSDRTGLDESRLRGAERFARRNADLIDSPRQSVSTTRPRRSYFGHKTPVCCHLRKDALSLGEAAPT